MLSSILSFMLMGQKIRMGGGASLLFKKGISRPGDLFPFFVVCFNERRK